MIWILDLFIAGLGFIVGSIFIGWLTKNKIEALETQLYAAQRQSTKVLCGDCQTSKILEAREADLAAVAEDRERLIRANNQYRGMAFRLAEKLRRMAS